LQLNEFDMTVILGNLLDNAVEACTRMDEANRYIDLNITYKPDYLVIQIENPMGREPVLKNGAYRTTKPDFDNHGFGLDHIAYLVSRHNGLMKIEPDGGVFKVSIALMVK
jgi:sensor histidine kinase regulating citrate/malate metabolism